MSTLQTVARPCSNPAVFEALTAYSFGDLDAADRQRVSSHVLECAICASELDRLESCVRALRHDPQLMPLKATPEVVSALGMSGRLDQPFGGHGLFVVPAAALFALLHAVPVVVEVAYRFDQFGGTAVPLAFIAFAWMLSATLAGLWLATKEVRRGASGLGNALTVWAGGTALLCAGLWPFFPAEPTVEASFGTWPANLGYLKSVFYAWLVGPLFLLWPFHFVLFMQRELGRGHHRAVLSLLSGGRTTVPPRGTVQPPVWALVVFLSGLLVFNYVGVNHLFAALTPGPHANLFRSFVLIRAGTWIVLPAMCLWWYLVVLDDVRREAVITGRLLGAHKG